MKSFVLVAAGLTTLICGCASTVSPPAYNAYERVDSDKIALVNQHAKNNGIDVYWVNYPQRKANDAAAAAPVLPTGT